MKSLWDLECWLEKRSNFQFDCNCSNNQWWKWSIVAALLKYNQRFDLKMSSCLLLLLTVYKAVRRSHQSVPQTHVPVESKITKLLSILTLSSKNVSLSQLHVLITSYEIELIWGDWRVSRTCCLLKDPQWRWGTRSPQRQSRELSCCGTATSGTQKQRRRLVMVTVMETQEKSKQKMRMTGRGRDDTKKSLDRQNSKQTCGPLSFLPDMVWVCSRLCWSARGSNLHRSLRYRTTENNQRVVIRSCSE